MRYFILEAPSVRGNVKPHLRILTLLSSRSIEEFQYALHVTVLLCIPIVAKGVSTRDRLVSNFNMKISYVKTSDSALAGCDCDHKVGALNGHISDWLTRFDHFNCEERVATVFIMEFQSMHLTNRQPTSNACGYIVDTWSYENEGVDVYRAVSFCPLIIVWVYLYKRRSVVWSSCFLS